MTANCAGGRTSTYPRSTTTRAEVWSPATRPPRDRRPRGRRSAGSARRRWKTSQGRAARTGGPRQAPSAGVVVDRGEVTSFHRGSSRHGCRRDVDRARRPRNSPLVVPDDLIWILFGSPKIAGRINRPVDVEALDRAAERVARAETAGCPGWCRDQPAAALDSASLLPAGNPARWAARRPGAGWPPFARVSTRARATAARRRTAADACGSGDESPAHPRGRSRPQAVAAARGDTGTHQRLSSRRRGGRPRPGRRRSARAAARRRSAGQPLAGAVDSLVNTPWLVEGRLHVSREPCSNVFVVSSR